MVVTAAAAAAATTRERRRRRDDARHVSTIFGEAISLFRQNNSSI